MEIKNPGIVMLAVLIVIIAGCALFGILELAAGGDMSASGADETDAVITSADLTVATPQWENVVCDPDHAQPDSSCRMITDSVGREVTIPANITKVLGSLTLVYLIAPEKIGAWESELTDENRRYYSAISGNLPTIGRSSGNYEAYIALNPDLVFISCGDGNAISPDLVNMTQEKYGRVPVVCLNNTQNVTNVESSFRFLGDVLGVPERADELIGYYRGVLDEVHTRVSAIPEEERVRVYYAEGTNGLSTDASGSIHSQLIDLCGGDNVATCEGLQSGSGMTGVTMESVLIWNPEVIITTSKEFAAQVYDDETWSWIPAVQNRRIYVTPSGPSNWFDRPPGVNRIVGIPWTAHVLYPDLFPEEWLKKKVKEFFSLYYYYDISDEDLVALLDASLRPQG